MIKKIPILTCDHYLVFAADGLGHLGTTGTAARYLRHFAATAAASALPKHREALPLWLRCWAHYRVCRIRANQAMQNAGSASNVLNHTEWRVFQGAHPLLCLCSFWPSLPWSTSRCLSCQGFGARRLACCCFKQHHVLLTKYYFGFWPQHTKMTEKPFDVSNRDASAVSSLCNSANANTVNSHAQVGQASFASTLWDQVHHLSCGLHSLHTYHHAIHSWPFTPGLSPGC